MLEAEAAAALLTHHPQHLSPPAALPGAAERKHLCRLLPRGTPTVSIHVRTDHHIGDLPPFHWDGAVTEWAHRDPDILGECKGTLMCSIGKMIFTEILFTRITF